MRIVSPAEMDAVLRLDGPTRYEHFVKRVVDEETAWGLWNEGWALMGGVSGQSVFPLWPAEEYAALCAVGEWQGYAPEEIALAALVDELLPKLADQGVLPAVFPTPAGKGVVLTSAELTDALRTEMENYE